LQVENDGRGFNLALNEHAANEFVFVEWLHFAQDDGDDISHGARGVAPFGEGVEATPDEDEAAILDELVVNSLDRNVALGGT
jgi:hypothetical protein